MTGDYDDDDILDGEAPKFGSDPASKRERRKSEDAEKKRSKAAAEAAKRSGPAAENRQRVRTSSRVKLLLWGAPDQGKTAYLWGIGRRLRSVAEGGFQFSELQESFQRHWSKLNEAYSSERWVRTALPRNAREFEGSELSMFWAWRAGIWNALRRTRVELTSEDVPGELILKVQGSVEGQLDKDVAEHARQLCERAQACFIVLRGDKLVPRTDIPPDQARAEAMRDRDSADNMIRQSLSVIKGRGRTAIVLTACEVIPDANWRRRLGFSDDAASAPSLRERRAAAREYLCEQLPLVGKALQTQSGVEVFATAAFAKPVPLFVEDPLIWVLEHEFEKREREQLRRRVRWSLAASATLALSAAVGTQLLVAPLANAVDSRRVAAVDAFAPDLAALPSWWLALDRPRALAGLHADAVRMARLGLASRSAAALRALDGLESRGYHFTRAQIEAYHIELQRAQADDDAASILDDASAKLVDDQSAASRGRLDRYGESTMELRRILLAARAIRSPGDPMTSEILDRLAANRTFAVQHGEQVGNALFAQWTIDQSLGAEKLQALLGALDRLRAHVTREAWLRLVGVIAPRIAAAAIAGVESQGAPTLRMALAWPADDREVRAEMVRVTTEQCAAILSDDKPQGLGLRDALTTVYCADVDVATTMEALHLHVVDVLVKRRDEQGLRRLRPVSKTSASVASLKLAAADWASMQANVALDPDSAISALAKAYADVATNAPLAESLDVLKRYAFVADCCSRRHPRCAEAVRRESAVIAARLAMREGALELFTPQDAEWISGRLTTSSDAAAIERIEAVAKAVVARAAGIPPATVAVVVADFVTFLRRISDRVQPERMAHFDGLASTLVEQVLSGSVGSDSKALVQVVSCWRAVAPKASERTRLDDMAASIVNIILGTAAWNPDASDAMAWVLSSHEEPKGFLGKLSGPQKLIAELREYGKAALLAGKAEAAARAITALQAIEPGAARESVGAALQAVLFAAPDAPATEHSVWGGCALALAPHRDARSAFLAAVADLVGRLNDGTSLGTSARNAQFADSLSEVIRDEAEAVAKLPPSVRRSLVEKDVDRALQLAATRQADAGLARLSASANWTLLEPSMAVDAIARSSTSFDRQLAGLLDMRDQGGGTSGVVSAFLESLVVESIRRGGAVEDAAGLLGAVNRLMQRPPAVRPVSAELARILEQQCSSVIAKGDFVALVDRWRVAAACARAGLTPPATWPRQDAEQVRKMVQASALRAADGWTVRQATAGMQAAFASDQLDRTAVADWFVALGTQATASVLNVALADANAVRNLAPWTASLGDAPEPLRFACELLGSSVREFQSHGADAAVKGRAIDLLARIATCACVAPEPMKALAEVTSALPSDAEDAFARALQAQAAAFSQGDRQAVAAFALALASTNLGERGGAQYGPAFESLLNARLVADSASWSEVLSGLREARAWSEARFQLLADALLRALSRDLATGQSPSTLVKRLSGCRALLDAFAGFAERSGRSGRANALQEALEGRVVALLATSKPEDWGVVSNAFDGLPVMVGHVAVAQANAAIGQGLWAEAKVCIARIADAGVAAKMRSFVDIAESMVRISPPGDQTAFLAPYEVTCGEYQRFLAAMRSDGALLGALSKSVGWQGDAARALEVIEPEETAPELRKDDLPVHKVSWWGAAMYCAWRGGELPRLGVLRAAWGDSTYPWGEAWEPMKTNTYERWAHGESAKLFSAGVGADVSTSRVWNLHGNVREFASDSTNLGQVYVFGASAWRDGKGARSSTTEIRAGAGARGQKHVGVGFRMMLSVPSSWKSTAQASK